MATKTITSNQSGPKLPGATTPLFIKTQSVFTPDINGNPISEKTIVTKLLYTPNGSTFFVAAESTEGGKAGSWTKKTYTPAEIASAGIAQYAQSDGSILGPTAFLSLNTSNGILYQAAQNSIKQSATSAGIPTAYQTPLASSLKNTAQTNQDTGDDTGDDIVAPVNLEPQSLSVSIPEKASDKSDSNLNVNLRYPENMSDSQDNIIFGVKKLVGRKGINELSAGADFSLGENKYSNVLGTVVLPVQPSITDSNGVEWGGSTLNPIQAYAASMSMSMIDSPGGDITASAAEALNRAAKDFKTGLTDAGYKKAISLYFAQEAVGAQNLLSRTSGTILNPNLELLFNGPTLRPFNFTFRLSPRSESEAIIVKQIIKFFKTAMAVRRAKSEVFLKAPCIFNISYLTGVGLHQSLNQIKECALIGCDVDYTPDGTYMTFNDKDKTMTSYQLSLRFSELTPIYNTDYEDGHPIGY
jgi:hypothetical protein